MSYVSHGIAQARWPVLITVPHAGRDYPAALIDNLAAPPAALMRLEDRYCDLLARELITAGYPVMIASRPRAWIDLNRNPDDLDAAMVEGLNTLQTGPTSSKVRAGLGLIPRRLPGVGDLWRRRWPAADVTARIAEHHTPWHQQIRIALDQLHQRHGGALLLDLHSMPPVTQSDGPSPQIVVGDRFGRSAATQIADAAISFAQGEGYVARLNHPYAGGYTLDQHGQPDRNIHALQIEVDRALYLDWRFAEPNPNLLRIAKFIAQLAKHLAHEITPEAQAIAAE